jgi:aspartate kinase
MKVIKFGGGVLRTPKDIALTENVLQLYKGQKLVVVVSAFNSMTNQFEQLLNAYHHNKIIDKTILNNIKTMHVRFVENLFSSNKDDVMKKIDILFEHTVRNLQEMTTGSYLKDYDRIVSTGEFLSSTILFEYLKLKGYPCEFRDVRTIIKTDSAYTEATVNWDETTTNISDVCRTSTSDLIITQGFIGSDPDGNTTTLGREGSDFTAAVFAYCTDAEEVIYWKEVEGIYNADPHLTENYELIPLLSYKESVEQAFYGAKILHPKTIKPLQNKSIPISVKSFYKLESKGTVITEINDPNLKYPPIFIVKDNQILISVSTLDFSFISEEHLGMIFKLLTNYRLKVNLMQASAISFSICLTNNEFKVPELMSDLKKNFKVRYNNDLCLITIRHYTDEAIQKMITGKTVLVQQNSRDTVQYVIRNGRTKTP